MHVYHFLKASGSQRIQPFTSTVHFWLCNFADQLRQLLASGNPELIEAMQRGLARMIGQSSGYLEGLPAPVRTRIEYLEELQGEYEDLENDFKAELRELENKYKQLYSKYTCLPSISYEKNLVDEVTDLWSLFFPI